MCSIPIEKGATFGKMTVLLESKMFKCMQHSPERVWIPACLNASFSEGHDPINLN